MTSAIFVAVVAVGLFAIAQWGRRHVVELLPSTRTLAERQRKFRQYRRGATLCQVVAVLLLAYAVGRMSVVLGGSG